MRVKVNGAELEVNQYHRNGGTIVFIHFSGGSLAQWNGIVPYFMDKYHIVTLDLRGHGKSEKVANGYTLDNMAMDIIEVMNQLEINKAHIVGSSLGGEIAVSIAAHFPERILSIVAEGAIQNNAPLYLKIFLDKTIRSKVKVRIVLNFFVDTQ